MRQFKLKFIKDWKDHEGFIYYKNQIVNIYNQNERESQKEYIEFSLLMVNVIIESGHGLLVQR